MNVPVPKLRNTFWVHGLLLGLVLTLVLLLPPGTVLEESVRMRFDVLLARLGPFGLVLLVAVISFPIAEVLIQQCHLLAYYLASRKALLYRVLVSVFVCFGVGVALIFMESLLFLFVEERFPLDFGPIPFWSGFGKMLLADLPYVVVLMTGELTRQAFYSAQIRSHYELMQERIKEI